MNSVTNFKTIHHQKECRDFDEILEVIGSSGKFQKIFLYTVVCPIIAMYPFPSLSTIFMWDIPDHFCHVPGKPNNISLETWKNLTLPWETGSNGELRHSQCLMLNPEVFNSTIKCAHGWTYNKTDYEKTIPSEFDWVCDKEHYATQCFTYSTVGSAIGSVNFGILADKYGRRPISKIQKMVDHVSLRVKSGSEHCGKGVWTLFTKKRLAKNTQLLILTLTMNGLLYDSLTMNSTHMAGNQFLNYFYLSLIELPGGWVAGQLVEKTGRRWTQSGFFLVCVIFCGVCAVAVSYPGSGTSVLLAALGIKFGVSITSLVASIQSTELFPTQLRSTGDGFVNTMSTMFGIVGPYIVYSGSAHTSMPYVILGFCSIIGALGSACLPETFQQHLPETIEDANGFGKTHKFWSYLPNNPLEKNVE